MMGAAALGCASGLGQAPPRVAQMAPRAPRSAAWLAAAWLALALMVSLGSGFPAAAPQADLLFAEEDYEDEEANMLRERLQSEYGNSLPSCHADPDADPSSATQHPEMAPRAPRSAAWLAAAWLALALMVSLGSGFPAAAPQADLLFAEEDYEDEEANMLRERLQSEYGNSLFGVPDNETGVRVSAWQDGSGVNPEELGEYVEGDILFPPTRNGIRHQSARWPGGVVPFYLSPGFTGYDLQNFQRAINSYHSLTCLRFVPYSGQESDYLVITNDDTGCWSAVGRTGGPQQLNLQSPGCTTLVGTIEHELMHAVGFLHEQNRWERDRYVTVHWQNILSGREANFRPASRESTDDYGVSYDYGSVMHYSANAFSKNGQPTMTPRAAGVELLGQRRGFSQGDIEKINRMYKHTCDRRAAAPQASKNPKSPQH